jgi:hypothetical protein
VETWNDPVLLPLGVLLGVVILVFAGSVLFARRPSVSW